MEDDRSAAAEDGASDLQRFVYLAGNVASLLEAVTLELDRDLNAAKASLALASAMLKFEIERDSKIDDASAQSKGLASWQIARVRIFIDQNLYRTICLDELSAIARRSQAHFARSFKLAFGEPPHAYIVRRRLERAREMMTTTSSSLSQIALSVGFADQAHLCRRFKRAFGESPANWRRAHGGGVCNGTRLPADRLLSSDCENPLAREEASSEDVVLGDNGMSRIRMLLTRY